MTLRSGNTRGSMSLKFEESGVELQCADSMLTKEGLYGVEAHRFTSGNSSRKPRCLSSAGYEGGRFSSGRPIKRACGLCAGLAGAPIEVII